MMEELASLMTEVRVQAEEMRHLRMDIDALRADVKEMMQGSARKWNVMISAVISSAVAGVMGYLISRVFLS